MFLKEAVSSFKSLPTATIHQQQGTLPAGQTIFKGTLAALIGGKIYPVTSDLNTATLPTKFLSIPGADANGGVIVYCLTPNVAISFLGGVSKTLGVSILYAAGLVTVNVQLGTDAGSVVTSTAQQAVDAVLQHGEASKYLRLAPTGTGLGLAAVFAPTIVPKYFVLGLAESTYDNSNSLTDLVDNFRFQIGICRLTSLSTDPVDKSMIGGKVAIYDNVTVKATPNSLSYTIKLIDIDPNGNIYVDVLK